MTGIAAESHGPDCRQHAQSHPLSVKRAIGQSTRFQRPMMMARRVIDSGSIGEHFAVNAQFASDAEPAHRGATDSWRYRAGSAGNGHVINFGCHYVDTARLLIDQDPTSVSAYIGNLFSQELISEDQFAITAACDRGGIISISLYSSFGATRAYTDGYTVRGTEGCVVIPGPSSREITVTRGKESEVKGIDADLADEDGFHRLHRLFREAIDADGEVPMSGQAAMVNLEWGLAAYLSSERRAWVDLPLGAEHDGFMGPVVERTIAATRA